MNKLKWRGHEQKKAQRETKEWAEKLSDEDRTRMNIPSTRTHVSSCCDALPLYNEIGYQRCSMCGESCSFNLI